MSDRGGDLSEGVRVGRFVVVRDVDGRLHAVAATAVSAICPADDDGCVLLLPGARLLRVEQSLSTVLAWLDTGGRQP